MSHRDTANALAINVSHNSSSAFTYVRNKAEKQKLNFSFQNIEVYNRPFSVEELQDVLRRAYDTSAGVDEIHYQRLKPLPKSYLLVLLNTFNKIWISGDFPSDWRKAIIIPIPKPGKDPTNPTNYHPIALTSCICKTKPVVHNWFIKGRGMYCSVYGKVHIKDPLLLIEKSSICGGSGFPSKKCVNVTI